MIALGQFVVPVFTMEIVRVPLPLRTLRTKDAAFVTVVETDEPVLPAIETGFETTTVITWIAVAPTLSVAVMVSVYEPDPAEVPTERVATLPELLKLIAELLGVPARVNA